MNDIDDNNTSLSNQPPLSLTSLKVLIDDMNVVFNQQLDSFARKFTEMDSKFENLCTRVDEIDVDITTKLSQTQIDFHTELISVQNLFTELQQNNPNTVLAEAINHTNSVQRSINANIKTITDRICGLEGQAARLAAVENQLQISNLSRSQSLPVQPTKNSQLPQASPNNILTSTIVPNHSQTTAPPQISISAIPHDITANVSGISLDPTRIPKFNGQLTPIHPSDFLDKVDQYFLFHSASDRVKINFISNNFTDKAQLWYTTLLPPPTIYNDLVTLFRNYFWSNSLQRSIRNELYRPYYHRDTSTMSEHAMEWINRARHLQPPIDQPEMVDQITSHFSYNITLALRGLRITTTNDLIQQLTYLQRAYSPAHNNNNNNSNNNSNLPNNFQHQNSYNSSGSNHQNRYPPRQNNYNRNQPHNNNAPPPLQPERSTPSSGNSA